MLLTEWNWDDALAVACEEGREEERIVIARNLLVKGSTPEFVSEITGLDLEIVNELQVQG